MKKLLLNLTFTAVLLSAAYSQCNESNWEEYYPYMEGCDLSGADLSGANFEGAYLMEANLIGADLGGADLSGANLTLADFSGADLWVANLSGAILAGAYLSGACLEGAINFTQNNYQGTPILEDCAGMNDDCPDCSFEDTDGDGYDDVSYEEGAENAYSNMEGGVNCEDWNADFDTDYNCDCNEDTFPDYYPEMQGCYFEEADFVEYFGENEPWFPLSNFSGANFVMANLENAFLMSVNFDGADLRWANFFHAHARNANFSGADLSGANLTLADLEGANLEGAILSGACLAGAINFTQTNYIGEPILEGCAGSWIGDCSYEDTDGDGYDDASYAAGAANADINNDGLVDEFPVISIIGGDAIVITQGSLEEYTDSGANCTDQEDGDLFNQVVVSGEIPNMNNPGTYIISYNCSDSDGNEAQTKDRIVFIIDEYLFVDENEDSYDDDSYNAGSHGGDINGDGSLNVVDLVLYVELIINDE